MYHDKVLFIHFYFNYIYNLHCYCLEFQKIYNRLNINIIERGESFYQSRMESLVEELENKGMITFQAKIQIM